MDLDNLAFKGHHQPRFGEKKINKRLKKHVFDMNEKICSFHFHKIMLHFTCIPPKLSFFGKLYLQKRKLAFTPISKFDTKILK